MTKIHIKFDYTMFYYAALDKELQIRVTSMVECMINLGKMFGFVKITSEIIKSRYFLNWNILWEGTPDFTKGG